MISLNEQHQALLKSLLHFVILNGRLSFGPFALSLSIKANSTSAHHSTSILFSMDCDDVILVCDTESSNCSAAAAEDERSTAVAACRAPSK
jgi:hypothetical protein